MFRDTEAWEALRTVAVLPLLEAKETREPLRAWVAGCASGEDAYALGILVAEEAERLGRAPNARIFATDKEPAWLDRARYGAFPAGIEAEMDPHRLGRFFERENDAYRAHRRLRDMMVFAPHDLLRDPPISRLDLCICRHRFDELEDLVRHQALTALHFSLHPGGILFLGSGDAAGLPPLDEQLFAPIHPKWRIYRRLGPARSALRELWGRAPEAWIPAQRLEESEQALEVSREELECVNKELATMNLELRAKVDELEATTNDLAHVLSSTDIALLFLDRELRVRRFTGAIKELFQLISGDVGRPIQQLAPQFQGDDLVDDVRAVLAEHTPRLTEVQSHTGRWYVRRILPYRTDQRVDGVVITFVDITPEGGRVAVDLRRQGEEVEIRVADTGVGIAAEFLPRVFDRFDQGEAGTTRLHGGLGLGLAIAKQLVELHGGRIEAASDGEGQGATFTVRLPLPRLDLEDPPYPLPAEDGQSRESLRGRRVLLVEDSAATRESVSILLAAAGARVVAVDGAHPALESLAAGRPEILVSDIAMPGGDGYELLREVRRLEQQNGWPETPAVALSAHARREDRQQAIEAGFHEHLAKPVDPARLIATLARLVGSPGQL